MKLKNLCKSGRNATLNIEVNAGKVDVTLCVRGLDVPHEVLPQQNNCKRSRNGPAQQRRRERRTKARNEAEEASCKAKDVAAKAVVISEAEKVAGLNVTTIQDTANVLEESIMKEKELFILNKELEIKAATLEAKNKVLETIKRNLEQENKLLEAKVELKEREFEMLATKYNYWHDYTDDESEQEVYEDDMEIGTKCD